MLDIIGKKYGKLTIQSVQVGHARGYVCICACECGNTVTLAASRLAATKSCGCAWGEHLKKRKGLPSPLTALPDNGSAFNRLVRTYKKNAQKTGRNFDLSAAEFRRLTSSLCHYCGDTPSQEMRSDYGNNTGGSYIYNGLDRLDNEVGYEIANVVPCCYTCNRAKWTKTSKEYEAWLTRLVTFRNKT